MSRKKVKASLKSININNRNAIILAILTILIMKIYNKLFKIIIIIITIIKIKDCKLK